MHPIRDRSFRALLISRIFAVLSLGFFDLPFMWWVLETTGKESMVAMVALVGSIAFIVAAPFGGILADRYNKIKLASLLIFIDGSLTLIAGILFLNGTITVAVALVLLAITNLASALRSPSLSSLLPLILKEESYQKGNATMGLASSFANLISFALAGIVTSIVGVGWTLIIGASFLFIAIAAILMVKEPVVLSDKPKEKLASEQEKPNSGFTEGLRVIIQNPLLLSVSLATTVLNLVASPMNALMAPYALDLNAGASGFGYLVAAIVVGEIIGLAVINILDWEKALSTLVIGTVIMGLGIMSLAVTKTLLIAMFILMLVGLALSIVNVKIQTIFQTNIDKEVIGRAYGVSTALTSGAQPIGYALTGALLASIGFYKIFFISGSLVTLLALIWLAPATRKNLTLKREQRIEGWEY